MAVPSQVNPILAVNLPLVLATPPPLHGMSVLEPNAGGSPATEALRLSLLGVGAIHQAYLLARSGTDMSLVKQTNAGVADDLMNLAISYRLQATKCLALACQTIEGTRSDAALGASVTIALIDIFAGGHSWQSNMNLAKTLVSLRGGPGAIVAHNQPSRKPNRSGVTVSPARLLLEILTVYEVCGSFTSNEPPQLLGPGNSDWWLSHEADIDNYHSYSVENVFGMSRRIVELMARVSTLVIRHNQCLASISEVPLDSPCLQQSRWVRKPKGSIKRVENGNTAHKLAMQIMLLRDVFRVPRDDYRVQKASSAIIERCFESTKHMGMAVDLTWPVIIAGCQISGSGRSWVAETFEGFRKQCCFEIDTAEQIVCEVWRREDEGLPGASWRSVIADLNLRCLLI
ncbi:Fungal specific transcription factor domain [Rhizoctonia solani]|uniref:Fungal specific transcription factor domain n=1 Tax=Rhizoctonia solani TaxID=456999 RepID=A0A8H7I4J5_9AGAM|nr:Fungal specific transcription factor domain [Rhizoctonia solani]